MLYLAWSLSCQKHDKASIEALHGGLKLVAFTSQGTGSPEQMMHQEHLRRCDTTRREDLPVAK